MGTVKIGAGRFSGIPGQARRAGIFVEGKRKTDFSSVGAKSVASVCDRRRRWHSAATTDYASPTGLAAVWWGFYKDAAPTALGHCARLHGRPGAAAARQRQAERLNPFKMAIMKFKLLFEPGGLSAFVMEIAQQIKLTFRPKVLNGCICRLSYG